VCVADVLRPPIMARAPTLYIIAIWSNALTGPILLVLDLSPHMAMHQMSAAYRILGSTMLM